MKHYYFLILCLLCLGTSAGLQAQGDPQLQWVFNAVNASPLGGNTEGKSIAVDATGNRYVTGFFQRVADFDPSAAVANLTSVAFSQDIFIAKYDSNGNYLWAKAIGGDSTDLTNSIAIDGSGQVYITGHFRNTVDFDPSATIANLTSVGNQDLFIAKYDTNGNYLWAKSVGGSFNDVANAIAVDGSGRVHITGFFEGTVDFDPSAATANLTSTPTLVDLFIAKYDTNGNYMWAKAIGGPSNNDIANAIALDSSGQPHITGYFNGTVDFNPSAATANLTSVGFADVFIAKYDVNGNYLWAKAVGGTINNDIGNAIVVNTSGQVHIAGSFGGTADFDPAAATVNLTSVGSNDVFIAKYDVNGNYLWAKSVGGSNSDIVKAMALDGSDQVHITGNFSATADFDPSAAVANLTPVGTNDIFIAKFNASGNYVWAKAVGSNSNDFGNAIAVDSSGRTHITGNFQETVDFDPSAATVNLTAPTATSNCFVANYTATGTYTNAFAIGGYSGVQSVENAKSVVTDSQGNVYVTGSFSSTADFDPSAATANLTSVGNEDIFIAKYDANGNYLWAKAMGGDTTDVGNSIALDSSNQIHITGSFYNTVDFDPSGAMANLTSLAGGQDIFIAKYDTNGNYLWAKAMGGTNFETSNGIALDNSGQVHIVGTFYGTADFDPSGATANLSSNNDSSDVFFAKYDANGNYLWAKAIGGIDVEETYSFALDSNGQVHISGLFYSTTDLDPSGATANFTSMGVNDIFIAKYDTNGNYLWAKTFGGTGQDAAISIAVHSSGHVYFSGYFSGTVDFDASVATANQSSVTGSIDIFIAKYDASGNYVWAKSMGGSNSETTIALTLNSSGQVHVVGFIEGTVDLDPSPTIMNFTSMGTRDLYIAKYDHNGNYLWAKAFGGLNNELPNAIALNTDGEVHIAGYFNGSADFEPSNASGSLTAVNGQDLFLGKYSTCPNDTSVTVAGTMLTANATADSYQWIDCANGNTFVTGATNQSFTPAVDGNYAVIITTGGCARTSACQDVFLSRGEETLDSVRLYPNPTTSAFVIQLPYAFSTAEVVVTDMLGTTLKTLRFSQQQELQLSLDGAAAGVYFVQLQSEQKTKVFKVIKK